MFDVWHILCFLLCVTSFYTLLLYELIIFLILCKLSLLLALDLHGLPENTFTRWRGSLTLLRPQTNRKTRSSSACLSLTPGEAPDTKKDSATISKHCIMNIPSTSAYNESNTSPKVMRKVRQRWLMCSHNSLIRAVTLKRAIVCWKHWKVAA